jgi:hypothetical protein
VQDFGWNGECRSTAKALFATFLSEKWHSEGTIARHPNKKGDEHSLLLALCTEKYLSSKHKRWFAETENIA